MQRQLLVIKIYCLPLILRAIGESLIDFETKNLCCYLCSSVIIVRLEKGEPQCPLF